MWVRAVESEKRCAVFVYEAPVRLSKRHARLDDRFETHGAPIAQNEHTVARAALIDTRQTEVLDVVAVVVVGHCYPAVRNEPAVERVQ